MSDTRSISVSIGSSNVRTTGEDGMELEASIIRNNNSRGSYNSYFWQAMGWASIVVLTPIIFYTIWKASYFLCQHLNVFGLAWITCFIISFLIALWMESSNSFSYESEEDTIISQQQSQQQQTVHLTSQPVVQLGAGLARQEQPLSHNNKIEQRTIEPPAGTILSLATPIRVQDHQPISHSHNQTATGGVESVFGNLSANTGGAQLQTTDGVFNGDYGHYF